VRRTARMLAVSIVATSSLVGLVWSGLTADLSGEDYGFAIVSLLLLGVGSLLVLRVPENRVSWVMLAVAFGVSLSVLADNAHGLVRNILSGVGLFGLGLPALGVFLPLWFPTGQPPSPRWRSVGLLAIVGVVVQFTGVAIVGLVEGGDTRGIGQCNSFGTCAVVSGLVGILVAVVLAIASFVVRWVRSVGVERLQLRWLIPAFIALGIGLLAEFGGYQSSLVANTLLLLSTLLVPTAIAIAILRYRLYEIDRIVSRTVSYTLLAIVLAGVYIGGVIGLPKLIPFSGDLPVAASTLAAAALFDPLRRRVQHWVDRRFNRRRYDAGKVVDSFGVRLRNEVDLARITTDLTTVVTQTVEPVSVGVWVRGERRR
jgi:hypothetical protein